MQMRSEKIKPHQTTFLQIEVLISYRFYITGISNYTSFLLWQMCIFSFFSQVGLISPHPFIHTNSFRFSTYHFSTIIFVLYVNYAALYISCFMPLLAVCLILRRYKPFLCLLCSLGVWLVFW